VGRTLIRTAPGIRSEIAVDGGIAAATRRGEPNQACRHRRRKREEETMRRSFLPRWKFTDSCGQPRPPGALVCGCSEHGPFGCGQATRRKLMSVTVGIAGAGGFSAVLGPGEALAQVRVFPPPPPVVSPVAGLMDTHVHSAPDVFGRALDDDMAAGLARERGMEAIVLKNHVVTTADRAWFARKRAQGLNVFGGIVLNSAVGGINPDAVNWLWRMQGGYGRVV